MPKKLLALATFLLLAPSLCAMRDITLLGCFVLSLLRQDYSLDFVRYATGLSAAVGGTYKTIQAVKTGDFKTAGIASAVTLAGISILKPKDFLGWKSLWKKADFENRNDLYASEVIVGGGLLLSSFVVGLFPNTDASEEFFGIKFAASIRKPVVTIFSIAGPMLGNGVTRKHYQEEIYNPSSQDISNIEDLWKLENNTKNYTIVSNINGVSSDRLATTYVLALSLLNTGHPIKDENGKIQYSQQRLWLDNDRNAHEVALLPSELVLHIASFLIEKSSTVLSQWLWRKHSSEQIELEKLLAQKQLVDDKDLNVTLHQELNLWIKNTDNSLSVATAKALSSNKTNQTLYNTIQTIDGKLNGPEQLSSQEILLKELMQKSLVNNNPVSDNSDTKEEQKEKAKFKKVTWQSIQKKLYCFYSTKNLQDPLCEAAKKQKEILEKNSKNQTCFGLQFLRWFLGWKDQKLAYKLTLMEKVSIGQQLLPSELMLILRGKSTN